MIKYPPDPGLKEHTMSQSLIPIVFGAGVNFTEDNAGEYSPVFHELELSGLEPYYVPWTGLTRADQHRDRMIAKYNELRKTHDRVALGGHSGGAYTAVEAAAQLEQAGRRPHALVLYSLSPWYNPVFRVFMRYGHLDGDLTDRQYSPDVLGLTGPPIPALRTPVIMIYGAKEDFYMHVMAGAALQEWPGAELVFIEKAHHAIRSIAAHY